MLTDKTSGEKNGDPSRVAFYSTSLNISPSDQLVGEPDTRRKDLVESLSARRKRERD
jgi:hypothetical protein